MSFVLKKKPFRPSPHPGGAFEDEDDCVHRNADAPGRRPNAKLNRKILDVSALMCAGLPGARRCGMI